MPKIRKRKQQQQETRASSVGIAVSASGYTPRPSREFDVIIYGATGYTGKLVSEYLAQNASRKGVSFAIAGRNQEKVSALADSLKSLHRKSITTFSASVSNQDSLLKISSRCRVLIDCAGPFIKYGEPVVRACITTSTHYIDITGEPAYIRKLMAQYHQAAVAKNTLVIPACGFDSVPADLGTLFTQYQFPPRGCYSVDGFVTMRGGGMSYGTYSTIVENIHNAKKFKKWSRKNPFPKVEPTLPKPHQLKRGGYMYSEKLNKNRPVIQFPTSDPLVVRLGRLRSQESPQNKQTLIAASDRFQYTHYITKKNWFYVFQFLLMGIFLMIFARFSLTKNLLLKLQSPGTGPSKKVNETAQIKLTFRGRGYTSAGLKKLKDSSDGKVDFDKTVVTTFSCPEGYKVTALLVVESAFCILKNEAELPSRGGVHAPSSAMGKFYLDTLVKNPDLDFQVLKEE